MLDAFEIVTTSGVVLWERAFTAVSPSLVNCFIADVFIEKDDPINGGQPYRTDKHTLKWAVVKELGLVFVAVYRSLLHIAWIDKLVDNIRAIFVGLYGDQVGRPNTTIVECAGFDDYFDQQLRELEGIGGPGQEPDAHLPRNAHRLPDVPVIAVTSGRDLSATPNTSRPSTAASNNDAPKLSRRQRKAVHKALRDAQPSESPALTSEDDASTSRKSSRGPNPTKAGKATKKGRKWGPDGAAESEDDEVIKLDYSKPAADAQGQHATVDRVRAAAFGSRSNGKFVLKDLGDEVHSLLAEAADKEAASQGQKRAASGLVSSSLSTISGLFRNVVGGKVLAQEDLDAPMAAMEEHLVKKNVAKEAAARLCHGVARELVGVKTANFESINSRVRASMEASLTKMLTPMSSLDLLREIDSVVAPGGSRVKGRPYVVSIVGVNGVGKSTSLAKMCYFLIQNEYRVLIAAADTFRSGAVEQLAVHTRNLGELAAREGGGVDLFQKGYGKDAAVVARSAVQHAARKGYDVVLIDTAGRRHNDQRLMSSLDKFARFAQPDKIMMVGEALVGSDAVNQARNFNAAFGAGRSLDGFIMSKCDTMGDMVGTLVSLVHATAVPVVFVGIGQHYTDLRTFSVKWAVDKLLSSSE